MLKRILKYLLLTLPIWLFMACGSGSSGGGQQVDNNVSKNDQSTLVSYSQIAEFASFDAFEQASLSSGANQYTMSATLGGYDTMANADLAGQNGVKSLWDIWQTIKGALQTAGLLAQIRPFYNLDYYKVTYKSSPTEPSLTGLVIDPSFVNPFFTPKILVLCHPTEVLRKFSPSVTDPFFDGTFTKLFGTLFATLGYIVVIPDYPGMGDNNDTHPYCLESLGRSAATMIPAAKQIKGLKFKDEIHVIGFSEGGYAALATASYMKLFPDQYNLTKVAALSGPYDLNSTMKNVMINADRSYLAPYFLPYTINGYRAAYPSINYLDFNQSVVANPARDSVPYYKVLYGMLYGDYSGSQISSLIYAVAPDNPDGNATKNLYYGPISVATTAFQNHLISEPNSSLNQALSQNTLVRSNWYPNPNTQFFFAHFVGDDLVPIGNTQAINNVWSKYSNVTIDQYDSAAPLSKDMTGSWHGASIAQGYIRGMQFLLK